MRTPIEAGSTGNTIYLFAFDTSTKQPRVDLLHNTPGLQLTYTRTGDISVAISLALQTVNGAWTSGGFVRTNATDGFYRLDVPNAAVLAGVKQAVIAGSGVANVLFIPYTLDLVNYNPSAAASDAVDVVKIGGATIAGGAKMPSQVKSIDNNVITTLSIADGAFTAAKFADAFMTAAKFAANAIDGNTLATSAITEIQGGIAYQVVEMMIGAGTIYIRDTGTEIELVLKADDSVLASAPRIRSDDPLNPVTQLGASA